MLRMSTFARRASRAGVFFAGALACASSAFAAGGSISWGAPDPAAASSWAMAGAGAAAGGMVAAQAMRQAPQAQEMAKIPATLPMPQGAIYIEPPRPVSPAEAREQAAAGEAIRQMGPWTASWATLSARLNAETDPRAAWERFLRAMDAKPAPAPKGEFVAVSPSSLEAGKAIARVALSAEESFSPVAEGAVGAQWQEAAQIGASSLFRAPGAPILNGRARADFGRFEAVDLSWSATLADDRPRQGSAGVVRLKPGQTLWVGFFDRGTLWAMGVGATRPAPSSR